MNTTTIEVIGLLVAMYPRMDISEVTIDGYIACLNDIEPDVLKAATLAHISSSKWFPSVAELREAAAEILHPTDSTDAYKGWKQVKTFRVDCITDPLALQAINMLGGLETFGNSPESAESSWRMRFIEAYRGLQSRRRNDAMTLPQIRNMQLQIQERIALTAGEMRVSPLPDPRRQEAARNERRRHLLAQTVA